MADPIENYPLRTKAQCSICSVTPRGPKFGALLAYAEDDADGLMSPRFARLRPDMTVDEAISYLKLQARQMETVHYVYVVNQDQTLQGVMSFRDLFTSSGSARISDIMQRSVVSLAKDTDQEEATHLLALHDLVAIRVVDAEGRIKGIVTNDDMGINLIIRFLRSNIGTIADLLTHNPQHYDLTRAIPHTSCEPDSVYGA